MYECCQKTIQHREVASHPCHPIHPPHYQVPSFVAGAGWKPGCALTTIHYLKKMLNWPTSRE